MSGLDIFRSPAPAPAQRTATRRPGPTETALPITYGADSHDPGWLGLSPKARERVAGKGMAPPGGSVVESHAFVDPDTGAKIGWWVDVRTGEVVLYFRSDERRLIHRYRPADAEVTVRRAQLPAVPVATSPGVVGGSRPWDSTTPDWQTATVWQNLPAKARRHFDAAFSGRSERNWYYDASVRSGQGSEEAIWATQWDAAKLAGCFALRHVDRSFGDLNDVVVALRTEPWEVIVFTVPLFPAGDGPALPRTGPNVQQLPR